MRGYTLIETVVSLTILMIIAVPLVSGMYRGYLLQGVQNELTGTWLLEQEAACVKALPHTTLPVKRRMINNDEWTIRCETRGNELQHSILTADLAGRTYAHLEFYVRNPDGTK